MLPDDRINDASALLKVLSHPARFRLAMHLMSGEAPVSAMEAELAIRQPGLSQHLSELRVAGLVTTRREHKSVFYTLTDERTRDLLWALSGIFGDGRQRPPQDGAAADRVRFAGAAMFATVGGTS